MCVEKWVLYTACTAQRLMFAKIETLKHHVKNWNITRQNETKLKQMRLLCNAQYAVRSSAQYAVHDRSTDLWTPRTSRARAKYMYSTRGNRANYNKLFTAVASISTVCLRVSRFVGLLVLGPIKTRFSTLFCKCTASPLFCDQWIIIVCR